MAYPMLYSDEALNFDLFSEILEPSLQLGLPLLLGIHSALSHPLRVIEFCASQYRVSMKAHSHTLRRALSL